MMPGSIAFSSSPSGGRPDKVAGVTRAYHELGLADKKLSRKEEIRRLEEYLGLSISLTTLNRALRILKAKSGVSDND